MFGLEGRVGFGDVVADPERPIQFVKRRNSETAEDRTAHCEIVRCFYPKADPRVYLFAIAILEMRVEPQRACCPIRFATKAIVQLPMIGPNTANQRRPLRYRPRILRENSCEKLFSAGLPQSGEGRAVPGKVFVRFSIDPAKVAPENKAMLTVQPAQDNASAGRVRGHVELIERRCLCRARGVH